MKMIWFVFLGLVLVVTPAVAQGYRTDGGVVVSEQSLLLSQDLRVAYVQLLNIEGPAQLEIQVISSDGFVYDERKVDLPTGIKSGQVVALWNGDTSAISPTYWLYFLVVLKAQNTWYYTSTQLPVRQPELYREVYVQGVTRNYRKQSLVLQIHGSFDSYEPVIVMFNHNYRVSSRAIRIVGPSLLEVQTKWLPKQYIPEGKFLLTICQVSRCDSIQAKIR